MPRKLVNELTWSVSRDRLFQTCRRAYWYTYYGSWGGWETNAPPRVRQLYILKNMTNLAMWGGSIVHDVIAEALRRYAQKGPVIRAGELQARARQKLRAGWKDAVGEVWKRHPKRTNLAELYYGNGQTLPPERTDELKERVYNCLQAFADSPLLTEIASVSYLNWKPVDTLDSFALDGLKVWCAIDFAYQDAGGRLRIIDWKTGAEDPDALRLQLSCYALYAMETWHSDLSAIRLQGVFLRDAARVSEYDIDEAALHDARNTILTSAAAMREPLADVAANRADEENFPITESDAPCRSCQFREVCPKFAG